MRILRSLPWTGAALLSVAAFGQNLPVTPEEGGLKPTTDTIYVNTSDTLNNTGTESLGVAIARNGNVVVGWEDDGDALSDLEAVWTLYSDTGAWLTPETEITSIDPNFAGQTLNSKFLSFFRKDGSAVSGRTGWGPKIKANLFGDGFGMGVTSFDLGLEVPEFSAYSGDDGDFPAVQLMNSEAKPSGIVIGVPVDYHQRAGNIRIGDFDYLSDGNIVIAGESRQNADLTDIFGGDSAQEHVVVRIVKPNGDQVKAPLLVSETKTKANMWHGLGVTKGGFGVAFSDNGPARVRLFRNDGTPISTNIDLASLAGSPVAGAAGRGDGGGFHGNGNDAYAAIAAGADADGKKHVWVSVINTNGTLRWSKSAFDDLELLGTERCDVGIDQLGRVVAVASDAAGTGGNQRTIIARLFDQQGKPLGKTFYVSEKELPDASALESRRPRVWFRNDTVAIVWESQNIEPGTRVVALRQFVIPVKPGSIESVGLTRVVADTPVIVPAADALGNWEPYVSVLGTTTFLVEGNTFADGSSDMQRYVVALQPAAGGAAKLAEGFYADNGTAFKGQINASRQNGNPGRVAGDTRPGAVNYIVGGEASPHVFAEFQSGDRWNTGFDRWADGRYGTIQTYRLDVGSLTPTPLSKALDSANGRLTSGAAAGNQITRFGGDVAGLSNGNFVSVVQDNSRVRADVDCTVATIFAPDGTVVKDTFKVADSQIWANVAAFNGGFAVRSGGKFYFYNNAGVLQGDPVDQNATSGEPFDTGRGDGTRIAGHVNSPYVYLVGKVQNAAMVRVAVWDATTRTFVAKADVSEGGFRGDFDRATVAVDALNRFVGAWVAKPDGYEQQQVAARVMAFDPATKTIRGLTASFLPFVNQAPVGGIRSLQMSLAMTTKQILVAAKGEINLANKPDQGVTSPKEVNFYTVISHPTPAEDPTTPVGGGSAAPKIMLTRSGNNLTITSDPQPLAAGWVLQVGASVTGPWVDQTGANTPVTVSIDPAAAARYVRAIKR